MAADSGRLVTVAGQLATKDGGMMVEPGLAFSTQFAQCLRNIVAVVEAAGGSAENIAMMRAYLRDMAAFRNDTGAIRDAWREILGKHFPAMTMVEVTMLFDPNALVEIDAFAVVPSR
jgi:enamine deaminase RidA (YjgF/YER057c/UK114 family)